MTNFKCEYDEKADALYVYLSKTDRHAATTIEVFKDQIFVDLNPNNEAIGIEILAPYKLGSIG